MINAYELLKSDIAKKRPSLEQLNTVIFPCNGPKSQKLIELGNDYDCTHFLLLCEIITNCVLPPEYGGRGGHVVYIDNEHQFNPRKLLDFLESHLAKYESVQNRDDVLQNCLDSLTVLSCYTSLEFTLALLEDIEESLLTDEHIALVIVDGIDAFYWEDIEHNEAKSKVMHFKGNIIKLRRLCDAYKLNVLYTVDANYKQDIVLYDSQITSGTPSSVQVDYKLELRNDAEQDKLYLNNREIIFDNDFLSLADKK